MITIFNGRKRGLGQTNTEEVYLQVTVTLRQHLHLFKGAKFAIFMAIALHSDDHGWAKPSIPLLEQETGYNKNTISQAIQDLCRLEIDGHRVLLAFQGRRGNRADANRYLLFPTTAEVEEYEYRQGPFQRVDPLAKLDEDQQNSNGWAAASPQQTAAEGELHTGKLHTEKLHTENQYTEKLHTANPDVSITIEKKNQAKEEPRKRRKPHPHTGATGAAVGVGGRSKFSLEECRQWADHLCQTGQGITNPGGYAKAIYRTSEDDSLIERFLHPQAAPPPLDASTCPDCKGSGWWYPKGVERGIARCKHMRLPAKVGPSTTGSERQHSVTPP